MTIPDLPNDHIGRSTADLRGLLKSGRPRPYRPPIGLRANFGARLIVSGLGPIRAQIESRRRALI